MCACASLCQKVKGRILQLKSLGGALELITRSKTLSAAWDSKQVSESTLAVLIDFLISWDGTDFHSDEDEEELGHMQPRVKVTLKHTFRSQLATDIVRELDAGTPVMRSLRSGTELSVSKAVKLMQCEHLRPLFDEETVSKIAEQRKRKQKDLEPRTLDDDVVEESREHRPVGSQHFDTKRCSSRLNVYMCACACVCVCVCVSSSPLLRDQSVCARLSIAWPI